MKLSHTVHTYIHTYVNTVHIILRSTCSTERLHIEVSLPRITGNHEIIAADDLVAQPRRRAGGADLKALAEGKQKGAAEGQDCATKVCDGLLSIYQPPAKGDLRGMVRLVVVVAVVLV